MDDTLEPGLDLDHKEVSARKIQAVYFNLEGVDRQQIKELLRNRIYCIEVVREV